MRPNHSDSDHALPIGAVSDIENVNVAKPEGRTSEFSEYENEPLTSLQKELGWREERRRIILQARHQFGRELKSHEIISHWYSMLYRYYLRKSSELLRLAQNPEIYTDRLLDNMVYDLSFQSHDLGMYYLKLALSIY